jgi:putative spermidine/putrescine transport system permease protein
MRRGAAAPRRLFDHDEQTPPMKLSPAVVSWLQVGPLAIILAVFFGLPMLVVVAASFFDYDHMAIVPTFILDNYQDLFTDDTTLALYLSSIKFAAIVWVITLVIGFTVSYFLVFHIQSLLIKIGLFLVCSVPFWTSNIIRMISWIPFLGRNGIFNQALMAAHVVPHPLEFLLFSDFAVVVAYVHLFTLFMVVPIFNSMARIDTRLIEAAKDAGASRFAILREIVLPSKSGIALGSIFVVTQVMGDFFVVKVMSGGQSASVVSALSNEIQQLEYPPAAASAVILVVVVMLMVAGILRVVDVRKELAS